MRRAFGSLALGVLALLVLAQGARADFGLSGFDVTFTDANGATVTQAGEHPHEMTTSFQINSQPNGKGGVIIDAAAKDLILAQIPGFVGNPTAVPRCATADFLTSVQIENVNTPDCPDAAAVGMVEVGLAGPDAVGTGGFFGAVYNLAPPPGVAAKLGFWAGGSTVTLDLGVEEGFPYRIVGGPTNITQLVEVAESTFTLWGTPASSAHDSLRGQCLNPQTGTSLGICESDISPVPFLTMPRSCKGPLWTDYAADAWENPGRALGNGLPDLSDPAWVTGSAQTHDAAGEPQGMTSCGKLDFGPDASVRPTTSAAESSSGLEVAFDVRDEGLMNPDGLAAADIAASRITLPPGMTLNPSAAEGLDVCSGAQFAAASLTVDGCPESSKLGTLEVDTPILENHTLHGAFYQAAQADNPFDSLLAAYLVIRDPKLGIFVKLAARIDTDPATGQIVTTVEDMPPFPLARVRVRLRQGPRAPLVTPPSCDANPATPGNDPYTTLVELFPSSGAAPRAIESSFAITSGPGGAPCPEGVAPFSPGFEAGSLSNAAGAYSPFSMRLTRADGEQDLTRFSATLPPGVTGKIAGLQYCSDAALAAAPERSGRDELASPSCPGGSRIGSALSGAGVGTALTYVPGALYLAGPYKGAPLSVAAIVPAVAGPFDVGTIVTRVGLSLNATTGQIEVDGAASDPIPHILEGIPLKVRDIRVQVDRPNVALNPTSCAEALTRAQIFGSFADPFTVADDISVARQARYQAASCTALAFKPKLSLQLKGATKRAGFPALRAVLTARPGDANIGRAQVTLPRSAFLEQAHIRTICTRVRYAADQCPPGSVYGSARATTPLLDHPLEGSVYLLSSSNELPDIAVALRGPASQPIEIDLVGRVDSIRGSIRTTFATVPDAPVTKFVLSMQGGEKGLIVNSRNLCRKPGRNRATVALGGQNGRRYDTRPAVEADCAKRKAKKRKAKSRTR